MTARLSLITAVYNRQATIGKAIRSVAVQDYDELEYVVVDGMSNDGTEAVVASHSDVVARSIREADRGIYDALNKGLRAVTGDVIGFLHADDWLTDSRVLADVAACFRDPAVDGVYADLEYVDGDDPSRVHRRWISGGYDVAKFRRGWMPPHPTVYLRRECYEKFGLFDERLPTAADYELMVRMMVRHQIRMHYLPRVTVKMRTGGASNATIASRLRANADDRKAWTMNGLTPPLGLRFTKPLRKLPQFFNRS